MQYSYTISKKKGKTKNMNIVVECKNRDSVLWQDAIETRMG